MVPRIRGTRAAGMSYIPYVTHVSEGLAVPVSQLGVPFAQSIEWSMLVMGENTGVAIRLSIMAVDAFEDGAPVGRLFGEG